MTRTPDTIAAGAVVGIGVLLAGFVLTTGNELAVLAALIVAAVVIGGAEMAGLGRRLARVFDDHAALMTAVMAGFVALFATLSRQEHFPLLMLATVLIFAIACLGLTIQFGYAGIVNFAGAAFFGIGGYTIALLPAFIPAPAAVLVAGVVGAGVASILILPVLRTKGHYAALITIAFGILFRTLLEVNDALGGPQGLKVHSLTLMGWDLGTNLEIAGFQASTYFNYAMLSLLLFCLCLVLVKRLERSWIGINLDVVRIDETAAASFGIDVARWRIVAFLLGNFLIAAAGALYAMMTGLAAPNNFTFADSLLMLSIVILGGIGNLWAILPAAMIVLVVPEKLQAVGEYRFFMFAILVALILRFRSQGLFPRSMRDLQADIRQ